MGRIIYTISVPEHSVADSKLKEWKASGANVSALVCMMIEEKGMEVDHIENLKKKLRRIARMTDGGKAMEKEEWDIELGLWF